MPPLVGVLFFCSVMGVSLGVMLSLSDDTQSEVTEAFNSASRYPDYIFDGMVNIIYPSELQLNKANVSYIEASFLDLHLSILDGFV